MFPKRDDGVVTVRNRRFDIDLRAQANAVAAINADGDVSAIMHPVGFMYKTDEAINVQVNDRRFGNHKLDDVFGFLNFCLIYTIYTI